MDYTHPILDAAATARPGRAAAPLGAAAHVLRRRPPALRLPRGRPDARRSGGRALGCRLGGDAAQDRRRRERGEAGERWRSAPVRGLVTHRRVARRARVPLPRAACACWTSTRSPRSTARCALFGHDRRGRVASATGTTWTAPGGGVRAGARGARRAEGLEMPGGRVELLTQLPRLRLRLQPGQLLLLLRPRRDRLALVVAEVNNTFGDRHPTCCRSRAAYEWRAHKKVMHVSPFTRLDAGTYRFALPPPGRAGRGRHRPHPRGRDASSPRASRSSGARSTIARSPRAARPLPLPDR